MTDSRTHRPRGAHGAVAAFGDVLPRDERPIRGPGSRLPAPHRRQVFNRLQQSGRRSSVIEQKVKSCFQVRKTSQAALLVLLEQDLVLKRRFTALLRRKMVFICDILTHPISITLLVPPCMLLNIALSCCSRRRRTSLSCDNGADVTGRSG